MHIVFLVTSSHPHVIVLCPPQLVQSIECIVQEVLRAFRQARL